MRLNIVLGAAIVVLCATAPAQVGRIDTVGGTTMDLQVNGPPVRGLVSSPGHGIHVTWMYSATDGAMPDRNMRYNFYDYSTGGWKWTDVTGFMRSGINAFTERTGYGNLDADPQTGSAVLCAHQGSPLYPILARDSGPGQGRFEYCSGSPSAVGHQWPRIAVDASGATHCVLVEGAAGDTLYYSGIDPWCEFPAPVRKAAPWPEPEYPSHNIAASKVSNKVCLTWVHSPAGGPDPRPGFYRISDDGGMTWDEPQELVWPDAYGGDTLTSYHPTSLFPHYDDNDELHIVAAVMPTVGGQSHISPAQLWHWSRSNTPNWSRIHTAAPEVIRAPVGYNAIFACRPTLGHDASGNLFVAWEEFDGENIEPGPPELCRADVYYSHSGDNGRTWAEAVKLTETGTVTHRFPSIIDRVTDTVAVTYLIDQHAGFLIQGEGPMTDNPVVVQRWENPYAGVEEAMSDERMTMNLGPTIVRGRLFLRSVSCPDHPQSALCLCGSRPSPVLLDASGRKVMELVPGENDVRHLSPGVYFIREKGSRGQGVEGSSAKVVIQR